MDIRASQQRYMVQQKIDRIGCLVKSLCTTEINNKYGRYFVDYSIRTNLDLRRPTLCWVQLPVYRMTVTQGKILSDFKCCIAIITASLYCTKILFEAIILFRMTTVINFHVFDYLLSMHSLLKVYVLMQGIAQKSPLIFEFII